MALDINGYNATFKAFTDFAQARVNDGQNKAIARAPADAATPRARCPTPNARWRFCRTRKRSD